MGQVEDAARDDIDKLIDVLAEVHGSTVPFPALVQIARYVEAGSRHQFVLDKMIEESVRAGSGNERADELAKNQRAARALQSQIEDADVPDVEGIAKLVGSISKEDGTTSLKLLGTVSRLMKPGSANRRLVEKILEGQVREHLGDEAADQVAMNNRDMNVLQPMKAVLLERAAAQDQATTDAALKNEQVNVIARGIVRGGVKLGLIAAALYLAYKILF
jgi:hypothetical protein